jgi:tetratricopeptide (TPR) repeat protein
MDDKKNNNDSKQFDQIEEYLLNKMSDREKQKFEEELNYNPLLNESVEQHRTMIQAIEREGMREKIGQFHKNTIEKKGGTEDRKNKPTFTISRFIPFLVAASVLILVGIGLFRFLTPSITNKKIFSEFFEPDPGLITPMSASADYLFYDGMIDYKLNEYQAAITKWENITDQFTGSDTLYYFLGVAHLALENDMQAIDYLQQALQTPDNEFIHETRYYLGLAYLKQGKINEAEKLLEESEMAESKLVLDRLNN